MVTDLKLAAEEARSWAENQGMQGEQAFPEPASVVLVDSPRLECTGSAVETVLEDHKDSRRDQLQEGHMYWPAGWARTLHKEELEQLA